MPSFLSMSVRKSPLDPSHITSIRSACPCHSLEFNQQTKPNQSNPIQSNPIQSSGLPSIPAKPTTQRNPTDVAPFLDFPCCDATGALLLLPYHLMGCLYASADSSIGGAHCLHPAAGYGIIRRQSPMPPLLIHFMSGLEYSELHVLSSSSSYMRQSFRTKPIMQPPSTHSPNAAHACCTVPFVAPFLVNFARHQIVDCARRSTREITRNPSDQFNAAKIRREVFGCARGREEKEKSRPGIAKRPGP